MSYDSNPTRRQFLKTIGVASSAAGLSACFSSAGGGNTPSGRKSLKAGKHLSADVWNPWTEDAAKKIDAVINVFNQSQTAVTAHSVVIPSNLVQKLLAAINAGKSPDAAVVGGGDAYQLAADNGIFAYDDVLSSADLARLKKWLTPAMWGLGTYNGKLYFLPLWSQSWGIYVNTTWAKKRGVNPDEPPQTLEELDHVWEKLTTYRKDGSIDVLGGDSSTSGLDPEIPMARWLGRLVSDDGRTITANDPNNIKACHWIDDRWRRVGRKNMQAYYSSLQGRGNRSGTQDPFIAGLMATTIQGSWEIGSINQYAPKDFKWTVWPLPRPAGVSKTGTYTYGDGFVLPKRSPSAAAGAAAAVGLTGSANEDNYVKLFSVWQCVNGPNSQKTLSNPAFQKTMRGCKGYQDVFLKDLYDADYYLYPPKIPTSSTYSGLLASEWQKTLLGKRSVEDTLNYVTKSAQATLDQWHQQHHS